MNILRRTFLLIVVALLCPILSSSQWQWIPGPDGTKLPYLTTDGTRLFAGVAGQGVYVSTDDGSSWRLLGTEGMPGYPVGFPLAVDGSNLYCGWPHLYRSTDGGVSWGISLAGSFCTIVMGYDNIVIGVGGGIVRSSDNGASWSVVYSGSSIDPCVAVADCIVRDGDVLFAHAQCSGSGLLKSTDNGESWTNMQSFEASSFALSGSRIFASALSVLQSTDEGSNWVVTPLPAGSLAAASNWVFSGTKGNGIYGMSIGDSIAQPVNDGLIGRAQTIHQLLTHNGYLFAVADTPGVWRRPLSELVSARLPGTSTPAAFALKQNYPNPFNPRTSILYELPERSFVQLVVYDLLGRRIATLVNDVRNAGTYHETFDASRFASGIYVYRLVAGKFADARKMAVVK